MTEVDKIFEDEEFIAWWKREGNPTHNMDFIDVAALRVAYRAYQFGLTQGQP